MAAALARAPFPSASRLQPIPEYVAPNISGNVNSSLRAAGPETLQQEGIPQQQPQDVAPEQQSLPESAPVSSTQGLLLWLSLFAAIALGVFVGLRFLLRG